jgi:hypothetical protein
MNYVLIEIEKTGLFDLSLLDNNEHFVNFCDQVFTNFKDKNIKNVVFSFVLELYFEDAEKIKSLIELYSKELRSRFGVKKVFLILNEWYQKKFENIEFNLIDDLIYVNSFLYWCYYTIIKQKQSENIKKYSLQDNTRFLLLTGKPNKIQRSGLLYFLHKRNLLKHANYSFFIYNKEIENECVEVIKHVIDDPEDEIRNFLQTSQKIIDRIDIKNVNTNETHYSPIPFNKSVFSSSNFQVISETYYNYSQGYVISEKTWISIINNRPFILIGEEGILDELKRLGFKTFENYLPYKDYNEIHENRLENICSNIEYWVKNIKNEYKNISADVRHNYTNFIKYARKQETTLEQFRKRNNLTGSPEDLIPGYFTLPKV